MAEPSEIAKETASTFPFVEVVGPDGKKKRFAKGTRAGFAVDRFNKLIPNEMKPVVCITATKEGEESIEFGPDVELILYDKAWTLQSVSEDVLSRPNAMVEDETKILHSNAAEKELYMWSSSSQAPWAINESAMKTVMDKTNIPNTFRTKSLEDFYPGEKLPEDGSQECTPTYFAKIALVGEIVEEKSPSAAE